ncbi:NDR1/HIN1-like protein 13 [Phragmites australis]|uniref:NDR1/HIN1-like protein 13 n=1 Tax=Phragmites australis TaxID=29695 RepID=UPI002D766B5C|nr:NDR1/HIN1-like protein 13 [Phragmites australis]
MAEKPPVAPKPKPKPPVAPKPKPPGGAARPTAPPFKKPQLAPPPQVLPLKPPPAHLYRYRQQPAGARKHRRGGGGGCSCRRVCCLATGFALLALCLALAAACLAYLYYRPRAPSFHLQPLSPVRLRLGNSSAVSSVDATVGARVVSWNPNERIAFRYGDGEGRVALADADGDVALGWAPVAGFEHTARSVAAVAFVATSKGVVVDEAVAARVRDRYRRRQLAFNVVVDAHVGVRVGKARTGMVPLRLLCDGGVMAPRGGGGAGSMVGPMSKCQVYLFRVRWFSLN